MSTTTTPKPASTGIVIPATRLKAVQELAATARSAGEQIAASEDATEKAFITAAGVNAIREQLTGPIMADILQLADTPLGFRTDRPPGAKGRNGDSLKPYPDAVYKDVLTQALIRGLRIVGNEFNIIAGNLYVTKQGLRRLIKDYPGLKNFRHNVQYPEMRGGGAVVGCRASWTLNGVADSLVCEGDYAIPIKVNNSMGADAIQGKAESKLWKRVFERISGSDFDLDEEVDPAPEATTDQS